jgi:hypothetical protein
MSKGASLECTVLQIRTGVHKSQWQVVLATKFCAVTSNICGFSLLNLLHVTLLASRNFSSMFLESFCSPGIGELHNKEKKLWIKKKLRLYMLEYFVSLQLKIFYKMYHYSPL